MNFTLNNYLFDHKDHDLLKMVQDVLSREASRKNFDDLLNPYLNPHGIKEMAASQGFRIAHAMINLLHSLEIGKADDRLSALHTLHDEVMNITHSSLRRNTARVLLQIMKELVREQGDHARQLELAHDFRMAVSGKPHLIRAELRRYHLLEMPEAWNQIAFDDHVHDANTKGRKTPTHLIMDAWIKGIRRLTVNLLQLCTGGSRRRTPESRGDYGDHHPDRGIRRSAVPGTQYPISSGSPAGFAMPRISSPSLRIPTSTPSWTRDVRFQNIRRIMS